MENNVSRIKLAKDYKNSIKNLANNLIITQKY